MQITNDWFFNAQYGKQRSIADIPWMGGSTPELKFDANTTLDAINADGPPNPYLGRMYFDGDWRWDNKRTIYDELRLSTSYDLETEKMGRHRFALALSRSEEKEVKTTSWLALGGNPWGGGNITDSRGNRFIGSDYDNPSNRFVVRNYVEMDDFSTWRVGSWKSAPQTVTTDRYSSDGSSQSYPIVWALMDPATLWNYATNHENESFMAVTQSQFWDDRLVFTFGFRKDDSVVDRAGYRRDPLIGFVPDLSLTTQTPATNDIYPAQDPTEFDTTVRTEGLVFHLNDNFSLVANQATNIGVPDFRRTVYPDGASAPPTKGEGLDYGIDFSFLSNRINGRLVYYETDSKDEILGGNVPAIRFDSMYHALVEHFEETGNTTLFNDLINRRNEINPIINSRFSDTTSNGYELRVTANITSNWRLQMNASKTDRIVANSHNRTVPFLGYMNLPRFCGHEQRSLRENIRHAKNPQKI